MSEAEREALIEAIQAGTEVEYVDRLLASRDARLAAIEALIETLPRNEFGDEHYLAVDAAYGNVVTQLRAALHPDVESPSVGCCTSCHGRGGAGGGPCWDCRGTGCAHPAPTCHQPESPSVEREQP